MNQKYHLEYERGIANRGNVKRIQKVMERAKRGEELRIGFIGGSITQGSLSSTLKQCYAYRVYEWWCQTFPDAKFYYINGGIGGTTSQFGVARVDSDLLAHKPDFVIIEFSVNDESTEHFMETYEGLVRKVYGADWKPAVLLVHNVYYNNGANAQLVHGRIGRHYAIPAVSMQSAIYPEVVAGRIENRDITPDDLHPNDKGHELLASVITYFLEKVGNNKESAREEEFPAPLTANAYEQSERYCNKNSAPELKGFVADTAPQRDITDCFKCGWTASKLGDSITFLVEGTGIAVQYRKSVLHPAPVAEVVIDGDEAHALRLDANFEENWGDKLELDTVLAHGEHCMHQVKIRLVEAHEEDAVPFYLVSVIGSY